MHQRGTGSSGRHLRLIELPDGPERPGSRKRTVEAAVRRAAIGTACVVLALYTAVTKDWVGLLGALSAAAAVSLTLVPIFWLLNNPEPGPRLEAVRDEEQISGR